VDRLSRLLRMLRLSLALFGAKALVVVVLRLRQACNNRAANLALLRRQALTSREARAIGVELRQPLVEVPPIWKARIVGLKHSN